MSFFRQSVPAIASSTAPAVTPQYTGLQIQTSSSALPIPILYGTNRLAPNLIWAGGFKAHPHFRYSTTQQVQSGKGGFFGGGTTTTSSTQRTISGYTYSTALVFALCEGPIAGIGAVYRNQGVRSLTGCNLSLLPGTTPQAAWSYLSASFPSATLAYQGTALAVSSRFSLGSSASIGTLSFETRGLLAGSSGLNPYDADPAQIVLDLLTNPQLGAGFPSASIDAASLLGISGDASYQTYCKTMGFALSPCLSDQQAANAILSRWLQLTNSAAIWSGGRLKFLSYGDAVATGGGVTFQPNTTPVADLTDEDFIGDAAEDPVIATRADPCSVSNVQTLEILDRAHQYSATAIEARDQNAVEQTGLRTAPAITAHEICDAGVAAIAAQLILQRRLYVRNSYAFKLSWEYCLLEPMDIVTLTDAGLGLDKTPVRITAISEDEDGLLSVTAEECPGQIGTASAYPVASASGVSVDRAVTPAAVNTPVIIEPPAALTDGASQLWVGLSGGSGGAADRDWGGAAIYASTDDAAYVQVGAATGAASQGVLAAAIGAPPGAPADTLVVDFSQSGAEIVTVAAPTLVAVDGEIMSFSVATLVSANVYSLSGLKRVLYGQRGGPHAVGAAALILDDAVFTYALPPASIGRPLWFKFASYNTFGEQLQDLSDCTAYAYTPVGSGYRGPVAQAIATGTSLDEGLASALVTETDTFGVCADAYTDMVDMGLASEAAVALAVQSGGTGATSASTARSNIGAAAAGANADITSLTNLSGIGIGTDVDTSVNKLAVKSSSLLFDNIGGGVQQIVNKAGASDTATLNYQTGYSTRAVAGLLGSDRYRISVSAAGTGFAQAIDIDPATGNVGLAGYTADANNALGVTGTACLFTAAADSMRFGFNKVATGHDASLSFQTGFSTRALAGLLGSDDWQLKVSADGASYAQVFVVDRTNGNAAFKALVGLASFAVAALPAGFNGALVFATNGRKPGEAAGAGTGVTVAFSGGQWRRLSDDSVVAA